MISKLQMSPKDGMVCIDGNHMGKQQLIPKLQVSGMRLVSNIDQSDSTSAIDEPVSTKQHEAHDEGRYGILLSFQLQSTRYCRHDGDCPGALS